MFKSMIKRSLLSIRRKIGRTVILVLIFFMMANLVLAAIIVKSAVGAQMDYAKQSLGGKVTIQADMEKLRENQKEQIEAGGDRKELFGSMMRPQISVSTADEIANYSDYVKDYSYEISAGAYSGDLEVVENTMQMPGGMGGPGGGRFEQMTGEDEETALDQNITISGINAYAYIDGVQNSSMEIKSGNYFDESSDGGVMISYEFAELNELEVGDKITFQNIYDETKIELEVIGVYDNAEGNANANTMYMNIATAAQFLSEDDYNDGDFDVSDVTFYMLDSGKAEEFVEKINQDIAELSENDMKVSIDTSEYDAMAGSIEDVGSFATTILVIVVVAAVIIITLIVTINIKDRNYEMGVLLSLGASKMNIVGQIALELIVVATVGFAAASLSGGVLARVMGDSIIASQQNSAQEQSEKNFGRPTGGIMQGGGMSAGEAPDMPEGMPEMGGGNNIANNIGRGREVNIELDINARPTDYLLLFVVGYSVVIVALILPSINILKYQPKEILTGKE